MDKTSPNEFQANVRTTPTNDGVLFPLTSPRPPWLVRDNILKMALEAYHTHGAINLRGNWNRRGWPKGGFNKLIPPIAQVDSELRLHGLRIMLRNYTIIIHLSWDTETQAHFLDWLREVSAFDAPAMGGRQLRDLVRSMAFTIQADPGWEDVVPNLTHLSVGLYFDDFWVRKGEEHGITINKSWDTPNSFEYVRSKLNIAGYLNLANLKSIYFSSDRLCYGKEEVEGYAIMNEIDEWLQAEFARQGKTIDIQHFAGWARVDQLGIE